MTAAQTWKSLVRGITPPVIVRAAKRLGRRGGDGLFDGSAEAFMRLAAGSRVYGEYGCGASTLWMVANTGARVLSVDTSEEWCERVRSRATASERLELHRVDLGPVGDWGRPLSYARKDRFAEYTDWIWEQPVKPDLVLVDGRFRVAAFLSSLLAADVGTTIVFDDYRPRPQYHVVEEVAVPDEFSGRQAVFRVRPLDPAVRTRAAELLEGFRYVMD